MQRFLFFLFMALSVLLYSCKDCEPIPSNIYQAKLDVYSYDSALIGRLLLLDDTLVALEAANTAIYADTAFSTEAILLPLSNQDSSLEFIFSWKNSPETSMQLSYQRTPTPVPPDCGIYDVYENLEVLQHSFDSISIVKSSLEDGDEVHIQGFLRE